MTTPAAVPHALADDEIDIIRMVARCLTNQEIADILGVHVEKFRQQLAKVHIRIGTNSTSGHRGAVAARVHMVVWAYEHGLMDNYQPETAAPPAPDPQPEPMLSGQVVEQLLDYAEAAYHERPRGEVRELAATALRTAGRLPRRRPYLLVPKQPA